MTGIFSLKPVLFFEVESVVVDLHAFSNAVKNGLAVCDQVVFVAVTEDRRLTGELDIERASFGEGDAGMRLDGGRASEEIGLSLRLFEERSLGIPGEPGIGRKSFGRPGEFNDQSSLHFYRFVFRGSVIQMLKVTHAADQWRSSEGAALDSTKLTRI